MCWHIPANQDCSLGCYVPILGLFQKLNTVGKAYVGWETSKGCVVLDEQFAKMPDPAPESGGRLVFWARMLKAGCSLDPDLPPASKLEGMVSEGRSSR